MIALLSLLLAAQAAPGGYFTAGQLKAQCEKAQNVGDCFAFIAGTVDASRAYQQWMNFREFCTPDGITRGELRDVAMRYLDLHPRQGDAQAASIVILALKDRYPCPAAGIPTPPAGATLAPPPPLPPSDAAQPPR